MVICMMSRFHVHLETNKNESSKKTINERNRKLTPSYKVPFEDEVSAQELFQFISSIDSFALRSTLSDSFFGSKSLIKHETHILSHNDTNQVQS